MGFLEPEFSASFDSGIHRIFQFLCAVADQVMADTDKQHSTGFSVEPYCIWDTGLWETRNGELIMFWTYAHVNIIQEEAMDYPALICCQKSRRYFRGQVQKTVGETKASLFTKLDWVLGCCIDLRSLFSVKTYVFVFKVSNFPLTQKHELKDTVWKIKTASYRLHHSATAAAIMPVLTNPSAIFYLPKQQKQYEQEEEK